MQPWKTISRRVVLEQPPFLTVENHEVELPDGRVIPDWSWVITPDFVNVVAITDQNKFLCFRQMKYGIEGYFPGAGGWIYGAGRNAPGRRPA